MSQSQVIFSTGLDNQPNLANILDATGVADQETRAVIEAVIEAAEKESPAIVAGIGVSYALPEAEAARQAKNRVEAAVLAANKAILMGALAAAGVTTASVQYEGSGDSGGVEGVYLTPKPGTDQKTILLAVSYGWLPDRFFAVSIKPMGLKSALSAFVDGDLISHFGHSGYENNEGGGGEAVFDVEEGTITLNHYDYIIERDKSDYVL